MKKLKITALLKMIEDNKKMVAALNQMLKHLCLQLESITKRMDKKDEDGDDPQNDISSESGMSDYEE